MMEELEAYIKSKGFETLLWSGSILISKKCFDDMYCSYRLYGTDIKEGEDGYREADVIMSRIDEYIVERERLRRER